MALGAIIMAVTLGATGHAHEPEQKTATPVSQTKGAPVCDETVKTIFERGIPNISGKSLTALEVTDAPGGKSPPHFHTKSAFIYAHVLSGAIRSQVDDGHTQVYQDSEGIYENPGSHHRVSENASTTEPASLLAVFITDPTDTLTIPEQK